MKLEDLKEGVIYKCKLSNKGVLIIRECKGDKDVKGLVYNEITGDYEVWQIYEGQLIEKFNNKNSGGYK